MKGKQILAPKIPLALKYPFFRNQLKMQKKKCVWYATGTSSS